LAGQCLENTAGNLEKNSRSVQTGRIITSLITSFWHVSHESKSDPKFNIFLAATWPAMTSVEKLVGSADLCGREAML